MKAKSFTKHTLSLGVSLIMMLLVFSIGFSVFAADPVNCEHKFLEEDGWTVVDPATCQQSGKESQYCYNCFTTITRDIPLDPDAHMMGPWEVVVPHSCTSTGVERRQCELCKKPETAQDREIPAHDYSVLYGEEATCMKDGYEFKACLTCYNMVTETIPMDENAHSYGDWVITKEATCVSDSGERTKKCTNRSEDGVLCESAVTEPYTDPDNHTNIVWEDKNRVDPDCERSGYRIGICQDCKREVKMIIPQHSQVPEEDIEVVSIVKSTCHTHGMKVCKCICGHQYEVELELDENNHEYGEWHITKQPGCQKGIRTKYCKYHAAAKVEEVIPATTSEHTYGEWKIGVEPTCSKTGTRVKECTVCGDKITEAIPTFHVYTTWKDVDTMECKEGFAKNGVKVAECNNCDFKKEFVIPALHSFGGWIITEYSDCKIGNTGIKQRKCDKCGKVESQEYTKEHDFTIWIVKEAPACATDDATGRTGTYIRWCKSCKYTETKTIPAEHEYGEWEFIEYPKTCGDPGKRVAYCKFCGDEKVDQNTVLEHIFGEWRVTQEPDCKNKQEGKRVRTCINCAATETESFKGHKFGDWDLGSSYKCNNSYNGTVSLKRYCTLCGIEDSTTKNFSGNIGHPNFKTIVVEPSCTISGYTMDYCPDCKYEKIYDITPAKGHEFSANWKDMVTPTCTSAGSRYRDCANCDYIDYVEIEKTRHTLVTITPGFDSTCTQEGMSGESYCASCKEVFESVPIPAKGHDFGDGEICKVCKAYKESENCTCACHSTVGIERIVFQIINKLYQLVGINQQCKCGVLHYEEAGFLAKLFGKG